jgi:hypothetical protein
MKINLSVSEFLRWRVPMTLAFAMLGGASALASSGVAVRDQFLSRALYFETSGCQVIKVEFNAPMRYVSHYPYERGVELRIELAALSVPSGDERRREALKPPSESEGVLVSIVYEGNAVPKPLLTFTFRRAVTFKVAQGEDFRSLIIAIAKPEGSGVCNPDFPATE